MALLVLMASMIIHAHVPMDSLVNFVKSVRELDLRYILKHHRALIMNAFMVCATHRNLLPNHHRQMIICANVHLDIQVIIVMFGSFFLISFSLKILYFIGKLCEYLTSLTFVHNNSYVEMEPLRTRPEANITMIFSSSQQDGVLMYFGAQDHLAVELFNGRIRVSYDVGNHPVSTMYR